MRGLVFLLLFFSAAVAHGQPVISGKISLTGLYYVEQEQAASPTGLPQLALPSQIGFGDVRGVLYGRGLLNNHLDFRLDMRVRGSSTFDFEHKFDPQALGDTQQFLPGRGYLGGPEYDLREVNITLRFGARVQLGLGRMYIPEADMLKVDALRLNLAASPKWTLGLFAGGLPNPYSRSLFTDYEPPCGSGVAASNGNDTINLSGPIAGTPSMVPAASGPCQTAGPQFAFAGGLTAAYRYERLWGNFGLVGSFLSGDGDGGPVVSDPTRQQTVFNLLQPDIERDKPRIFFSSNIHVRPADRLDLFANLVIDFLSSAGPQVTRALATANLRLLRGDRLTVRLTYSHMSSLAINMFLNRQLYNRTADGTTLFGMGIVENNLTVMRTGRDDVRLGLDLKVVRKLVIFTEGRFRYRTLLNGDSNSNVYGSGLYGDNTSNIAGDATVGIRDGGSVAGLRGLLSYMFLSDFRAQSHIFRLSMGRAFLRDRLGLDIDYTAVVTHDNGASGTSCNANQFPSLNSLPVYQLNPAVSVFLADCYGRRSGITHEVGATFNTNPWRRLFFLVDYRFTALLTDPELNAANVNVEVPTVLSHMVLLRAEYGF